MLIDSKLEEKKQSALPREKGGARHRWHAVTIIGTAAACAAAQACKGKRILSSEAPRLPLPGCDAARCDCKYRHFGDRRAEPRRAAETGFDNSRVESNRRGGRGRRATD